MPNQTHNNQNDASTRLLQPVGIFFLSLVFIAGAGFTFEFLKSNIPLPVIKTQAAAVAVVDPFASSTLEAKSAYVYDISTKRTLYSLDADETRPLASLTKVATVLAVSEVLPPDSIIIIPTDTAPAGSPERLVQGDSWRVQDVINFTLIASSNEGAQILADAANDDIHAKYPQSPSTGATLWRMNNLAQQLGLTDMRFSNPSGLDIDTSVSGAYGSARDVATLFAYAASTSPQVFAGTTRNSMSLSSINGDKTSAFNTDEALGDIPGIIMGKTGLTDLAGGNLAVVFDVGPAHPVVAVVMGSTVSGRFSDMKQLVAAAQKAVAAQ